MFREQNEDTKEIIKTLNRRVIDNTVAKAKKDRGIVTNKILQRKLDCTTGIPKKPGVNSGSPER